MIAGHFGFAAAVKARERQAPLWALMLATQWLDVIFLPLFVTGIERIVPAPGTSGTDFGEILIYADYTHSLLGAIVLSLVFGGAAAAAWGRRTGIVLGAVAFSHWILDLFVHRADMPLLPGNMGQLPRMGIGLWRMPMVTTAIELALVIGGAYLYWRAAIDVSARARQRDTTPARLANIAGAMVLAAGLLTLILNLLGV